MDVNQIIAVHATNVSGTGAYILCKSLFHAISGSNYAKSIDYYLPMNDIGASLANNISSSNSVRLVGRLLPNSLSRFIECMFPVRKYNKYEMIVVMGDIPLKVKTNQVVYVHQPHLIFPSIDINSSKKIKYSILRFLFRSNLKYATQIVVQTTAMSRKLIASYPEASNKITVVGVPLPDDFSFYLNQLPKDRKFSSTLTLFYPAAFYSHKNHLILSDIDKSSDDLPVKEIYLTIDAGKNPCKLSSFIKCVGKLSVSECAALYRKSDALLFLSKNESYGLPLVEAMYAGIYIICPDLDYARVLCGAGAIYFNPNDVQSLCSAIKEVSERIESAEYPNWEKQLNSIPKNWQEVFGVMVSSGKSHQ